MVLLCSIPPQEDDVRKYVNTYRRSWEKNGKKHSRAPKIQRLITPEVDSTSVQLLLQSISNSQDHRQGYYNRKLWL
jgi:hypothetical protein